MRPIKLRKNNSKRALKNARRVGRHFEEEFNLLPPLRKDSFSYLKSAGFNFVIAFL